MRLVRVILIVIEIYAYPQKKKITRASDRSNTLPAKVKKQTTNSISLFL